MNHRAVFMARDGTINEEVGHVNHIDRFRLYPWSAGAIRKLNAAGFKSIVITNQSGVARGMFPESLVSAVHDRLRTELARAGAFLDGIYHCPHHPDGREREYSLQCDCRKPAAGLLLRAARELDVDVSRSFVIGDKYTDLQMAFAVGAKAVLVLSGYGKGELEYRGRSWSRMPDHVAANLAEAVDWIMLQPLNPQQSGSER